MAATLGEHRAKVQLAFERAFSLATLGQFTQLSLELNLELLDGGNLRDKIFHLVVWAEQNGRLRELLQKARDARPEKDEMRAVVGNALAYLDAVAPAPWYEPPDPYDSCYVRNTKVFMNRHTLRKNLRDLVSEGGSRTLVVDGPDGSGRSYSLQMIVFLGSRLRAYEWTYVDLRQMGADVDPGELMTNIARSLGLSAMVEKMPELNQEQASRWSMNLAYWLVGETRERGQLWIVIDGINQVSVAPETLDLIMWLVRIAETASTSLRLILLACSEPLPTDIEQIGVAREQIDVIDGNVVADFFNSFATHKGIAADEAAISAVVDSVMAAAPPDGPDGLAGLSAAVAAAAQRLAPDTPAGN